MRQGENSSPQGKIPPTKSSNTLDLDEQPPARQKILGQTGNQEVILSVNYKGSIQLLSG